MFLANIEAAERIDESDDDMTAAETAPRPTNETAAGVRYCKTIGRTKDVCDSSSGRGPGKSVSFQAI